MFNLLSNAFSLQMLNLSTASKVYVTPVTAEEVAAVEDIESYVGHADTAAVLSSMLGKDIKFNRASLKLGEHDVLYVAQVTGGRLPEGCTELPEGVNISFVRITVKSDSWVHDLEKCDRCKSVAAEAHATWDHYEFTCDECCNRCISKEG